LISKGLKSKEKPEDSQTGFKHKTGQERTFLGKNHTRKEASILTEVDEKNKESVSLTGF